MNSVEITFNDLVADFEQNQDDVINTMELIVNYIVEHQIKTMNLVIDEETNLVKSINMFQAIYNNLKKIMDCVSNIQYVLQDYQSFNSIDEYNQVLDKKIELVREMEKINDYYKQHTGHLWAIKII